MHHIAATIDNRTTAPPHEAPTMSARLEPAPLLVDELAPLSEPSFAPVAVVLFLESDGPETADPAPTGPPASPAESVCDAVACTADEAVLLFIAVAAT